MRRLCEFIHGKVINGQDRFITDITNNSKNIRKDSLFFAIRGTNIDGHDFVEEAIRNGAAGVVVEYLDLANYLRDKHPNLAVVYSENTRKSLAITVNNFFDRPSKDIKVIGITGTNGKTSVSNIIAQFYQFAGLKTGVIGTINYRVGDEVISEGHTTPDPIEWFRTIKVMKEKGAEVVVAEVSSHALDQYRVYSTVFDGVIFTNLTQDHLDYHKTMENYFLAKEKIFKFAAEYNQNPKASVNVDDKHGLKLYEKYKSNFLLTSFGKMSADFKIEDINLFPDHTEFSYTHRGINRKVHTKLLGEFNVYNLSAAISYLLVDGFDEDFLVEKSKDINPVRGRFEVYSKNGITAVVDYAHTPDGLEKVLKSINQLKHRKVITVFGAGGNRDKTKRPMMGKIAEELSDIVILTSDNPRKEDPVSIIGDILEGIRDKGKVIVEPDREKAIHKATQIAKPGDIILIAGKGHETYQIVGDRKVHFDDMQMLKKYMQFL